MRVLLLLVIGVAGFWACYWLLGAQAVERNAVAALAEFDADPARDARADVVVRGFPNRFDLSLENLALHDDDSGLGWETPVFQLLALSYAPHHLIAVWPREQTVEAAGARFLVSSADMRASLVFRPDLSLAPDRSAMVVADLVVSGADMAVALASGRLATRRADAEGLRHDVALELSDLRPPEAVVARLGEGLPAVVQSVSADLRLDFDAPVALRGATEARLAALEIRAVGLAWGDMALSVEGRLAPDAAGRAAGQIVLRARNWRQMLDLAVAAGLLQPGQAQVLSGGLATLEADGEVTAPIDLRDGIVRFAGLPVGAAPRLGR